MTVEQVIEQESLEQKSALAIKEGFSGFIAQANELVSRANSIEVTDISQKERMKEARELRLEIKSIRTQADKVRKALKEDSIRYGRAVQGVYNILEYMVKPAEEHLEKQEKFAELQEMKRKADLKAKREIEIQPYADFVPFGLNLGDLSDEDYQKVYDGAKLQMQTKIEQEQKEKAEREEVIRLQKIYHENERALLPLKSFIDNYDSINLQTLTEDERNVIIANAQTKQAEKELELEKLRKQNEDAQRKLEEQQREARIAAEKAEQERLKAEAEARRLREEAEKKAADEAAKAEAARKEEAKARRAPDKQKLLSVADQLDGFVFPELKSLEALDIAEKAKAELVRIAKAIRVHCNQL